ncbi:MAG: hypothetical protein LBC40_05705 [Dysgonamonadaceae bacterium]|jgi:hypothetical protein|nr:hypothetical protein [Dysgonamonadaceae bacterium]
MEKIKRLKISKIWEEMERKDAEGLPVPFAISYVKKSTGEISSIPACICTSIHSKGATVNIMTVGDTRPKSIRKCLIIEFNNANIYM